MSGNTITILLADEKEATVHYENMPMQYIGFSEAVKNENFQ